MAEIKCPTCSTLNPEEAEECRFCGTRLHPVDQGEDFASDQFAPGDILAALRRSGGMQPGDEDSEDDLLSGNIEEGGSPDETPDWLKRIRQISENGEENASRDPLQPNDEEEVPDWIRSLAPSDAEPGVPPEQDTTHAEQSVEDIGAFIKQPEEEPVQESAPQEGADASDDWLMDLEAWQPASEESETLEEAQVSEAAEQPESLDSPDESELPDWLQIAVSQTTSDTETTEEEDQDETQETDDAFEEEFLQPMTEIETPSTDEPFPQIEAGDLSEWLSMFEEETQDKLPPADAKEELMPEVIELPPAAAPEPLAESETAAPSAEEEKKSEEEGPGLPEWMRLREESAQPTPEPEATLPDWLQSFEEMSEDQNQEPSAEEIPEKDHDASFQGDKLPSWLMDDLDSAGVSPSETLQAWEKTDQQNLRDQQVESDDLSEWLGDTPLVDSKPVFDTREYTEPQKADSSTETPPFFSDDLNKWVDDERNEADPVGSREEEPAQELSETTESALPDWLDEVPEVGEAGEPEIEPDIAGQTALPEWLAAMRPIDSVLPEKQRLVDEKKVEQEGPLAGMRAVLPAQDVSTHYRKPPIYSLKLQVSEKQRAHAVMLENVLEEEKRTISVQRSKKGASQRAVRAMIGLLLSVVVLLPLLGIPPAGVKIGPVADIGSFYDVIESLPTDTSVLMAVDYAPGYQGEMRFAASGVLQELMRRGLRIAALSTLPSGPVLAEELKSLALERYPEAQTLYAERDWFINMGYLPGETISLQELARNPQQAAQYGLSAGLENRLVWDSGVLQNISQLDDFGLLLVITDTVEGGRAWIEQVQPVLNGVPILMISSAQAAPLLHPYVQSGQVTGLLAGMAGGVSYEETALLPPGRRSAYWLSNQFGLGMVILFLLLGVIFEGISSLAGRNRPDQEA